MIHEIIIGTKNRAKVKQYRAALFPLHLTVRGIASSRNVPSVAEEGKTVSENARAKALAYTRFLRKVVLSTDAALHLEGVSEKDQPGLYIRRIVKEKDRPTDEELLAHFSQLIEKQGGTVRGLWTVGVCIAIPTGLFREVVLETERIFTSRACAKTIPGYPLESLQIDPESGRYIAQMTKAQQGVFWQWLIGKKVCAFVKKSLALLFQESEISDRYGRGEALLIRAKREPGGTKPDRKIGGVL